MIPYQHILWLSEAEQGIFVSIRRNSSSDHNNRCYPRGEPIPNSMDEEYVDECKSYVYPLTLDSTMNLQDECGPEVLFSPILLRSSTSVW